MRRALEDAELRPDDVQYINAHGTSTPTGDPIEVTAVKRVLGEHARRVMMSSTKSMTGHLLGAAGGLEAVVTAWRSCAGSSHPPSTWKTRILNATSISFRIRPAKSA